MKIAIISDHLPGYHTIWSGAELIAITLNDILQKAGVETFFLTSTYTAQENRTVQNVFQINTPLKKYEIITQNFPVDIAALWSLFRTLKEKKPDAVHINGKYLYLPAIIVCSILKIPFVYTVADYFIFCPRVIIRKPDGSNCKKYHGPDCYICLCEMKEGWIKNVLLKTPPVVLRTFLLLRKWIFNYYNKKVNSYIALSNTSKKRLVEYGIHPDKVKIVYHYYLKEPTPTNERIDPCSAVFVGWLSLENGTDILVNAFLRVLKDFPDAKLYLIGTGKERFVAHLKELIHTHNAQNNILFLGKKENQEALSILQKCAVVVVPHQWPKEFGPIVLIEAAALGKPVITSNNGASHEFITDTVSGFLVSAFRNPDAFAEKIIYLLSHPEIAVRMGEKGKEKMQFVYTNSCAEELIELYSNLKITRVINSRSDLMGIIKEQLEKVLTNYKERGFKEAYNFAYYRYLFSVHNHFIAGLINRLAPYPPYIEVEISTYCNLKCLMCEHTYWKQPAQNMTYDQFLHIMRMFPKLKWIDITGIGEGFMNKDYLRMIEYIKSKHIYLELYDPFYFWDKEVSNTMVKLGLNHIQPSFDAATEKTYNLIRKGSDFNRVVKNLRDLFAVKKELNKKLPEVSFHYIVSKQNIDEMSLYLDLIKDISNGDHISITFTKVLCGFKEIEGQVVEIPDSLINDIDKKAKDLCIKVKWNRNVHMSNRPDYSQCTLWTMPFIFVTGDVIPCCGGNERNQRDFQIKNSLGNVFKEDFHAIWKNEKYKTLRKMLRKNQKPVTCTNCPTFGNS